MGEAHTHADILLSWVMGSLFSLLLVVVLFFEEFYKVFMKRTILTKDFVTVTSLHVDYVVSFFPQSD